MTHSRTFPDSGLIGSGSFVFGSPVPYPSKELLGEPMEETISSERDSISVTVRFRPLSDREIQRGDEVAWYPDGDTLVRLRHKYNPLTAYAFDKVFGPQANTIDVYDVAARPVVKAAMEGVNGTVFAYGVTSSGKTHTMHGDQESPGIIPLAIKDAFSIIQDTPGREFRLRVSYLEIYNEVINDLLDPTGQNLRLREDSQGTHVESIKTEVVLSPDHALSFLAAVEEHPHVGSNNFNLLSSRRHTIFTLMVESSATGDDGVIFSQLNLIDLAGSESSKTETTGLRRKEGSYINKSLLTLGTVIGQLSEGKATDIPYRDSKVTRLLQSSLSGHGHVSLICTITPASSSSEETHNTLKFASRAKSERERTAFSLGGDSMFYTKGGYLWHYEFSTQRDSKVVPLRSPRTIHYSPKENAVLIYSDLDGDGGSYQLYIIPKDSIGRSDFVLDAKKGIGNSAIFISRDRFAVFEKSTNQVLVKNLKNELVMKVELPIPTDAIFYAGTLKLLCRFGEEVVLFDLVENRSLADLPTPVVSYVVWSNDRERVALLSKHTIIIASKMLDHQRTLDETIRVTSGAWDDNGVFIYTTLSHIKYCLSNGETGIVENLDIPIYITKVAANVIYCFDRDGKNNIVTIDAPGFDDGMDEEWEFAHLDVEGILYGEVGERFRYVEDEDDWEAWEDGWGLRDLRQYFDDLDFDLMLQEVTKMLSETGNLSDFLWKFI